MAIVKKKATRKTAKKAGAAASGVKSRKSKIVIDDDTPFEPGTTTLVVVESPAKARTIGKYLGRGYRVRATIGHVRDLPEKKLGIDVEKGFEPEYVTIEGKEIFLATDPDREGEAIAWHVASQLSRKKGAPPVRRVLFHEVTKDAIQRAI